MPNTTYAAGSTNKIITLRAFVISTGLPYTAGLFNTAGISATYTRDGGVAVAIALVTAAAGTYTSSGFVHAGKGEYELGAPAAALVAGADGVRFKIDGITDVVFEVVRVELTGTDPRSASPPDVNVTTVSGASQTAGDLMAQLATLVGRLTAARATALDFLDVAISSRSTYAGADTAGTTTLLARLTAIRAGLLDNLDAAISSRSTYAGADTAGTTTLLARLTAIRAGLLDNLDAAISSRSTYAGADTAGTTTLLARLTAIRAALLDNLDATISSRLPMSGYTAPLDAAGTRSAVGLASASLDTQLDALPTAAENADALLGRNQQGGSNSAPTVAAAIAGGLMKISISGSTLTVLNGDGTTAYTRTISRSALDAIVSAV